MDKKENKSLWFYYKILFKKELLWHIAFFIIAIGYSALDGINGISSAVSYGISESAGWSIVFSESIGRFFGMYILLMIYRSWKLQGKK